MIPMWDQGTKLMFYTRLPMKFELDELPYILIIGTLEWNHQDVSMTTRQVDIRENINFYYQVDDDGAVQYE